MFVGIVIEYLSRYRVIFDTTDGEFADSFPRKGTKFSTVDNDNDAWKNNCADRLVQSKYSVQLYYTVRLYYTVQLHINLTRRESFIWRTV